MRGKVCGEIDVRNGMSNFDGCTKPLFGVRMRAMQRANPELEYAQPTSQIRATSLTVGDDTDCEIGLTLGRVVHEGAVQKKMEGCLMSEIAD